MERDDQVIGMLETITKRLDGMDGRFDQVDTRLDRMDKRMDSFEQKLELQGETLKEHSRMLGALQTGQEHLKAEIDGMKTANEKEFGPLRESLEDHSLKLELVREETWTNKVDIHRIKTTMGMK